MAVKDPKGRPGIGRQYEKITDNKSDWPYIKNHTIFFDKKTDLLWYKTNTGEIVEYQEAVLSLLDGNSAGDLGGSESVFSGARDNSVTNTYLKSEGIYTNISPVTIPKDMVIESITANSKEVSTWTAEIHNNGVLISGASLLITSSDSGTIDNLNIQVSSGSKLMFYAKGTLIKQPRITIILK